jgi:hypothetical protein
LRHVNLLMKISMKKCIVNIKLSYGPLVRHGKRKNNTNGSRFDNGTKSIFIINALHLIVTFGNKTGFEAIYRTIRIVFQFVYPFTANDVIISRWRNKNPGLFKRRAFNS